MKGTLHPPVMWGRPAPILTACRPPVMGTRSLRSSRPIKGATMAIDTL